MTDTPQSQTRLHTTFPDSAASVGARIHEERVRLQLSQTELAEKLGISRTSATLYEAGKHLPRAEVLIGLNELGADVMYILTGRKPSAAAELDLDVMAFALEEVARQTPSGDQVPSYREALCRAWPIYLALVNFKHRSSGSPSVTVT